MRNVDVMGKKKHITQTTHARTLSSILLHEIQNRILIQFHNKPDVHKNFNFCIIITGMIFAGKCAYMIYLCYNANGLLLFLCQISFFIFLLELEYDLHIPY